MDTNALRGIKVWIDIRENWCSLVAPNKTNELSGQPKVTQVTLIIIVII